MGGESGKFQPTGNFLEEKRETIARAAHEKSLAREMVVRYECQLLEDLRGGRWIDACRDLADGREGAGTRGAATGGAAAAAFVTAGATAGAEGAGEAADLHPGGVEAESR